MDGTVANHSAKKEASKGKKKEEKKRDESEQGAARDPKHRQYSVTHNTSTFTVPLRPKNYRRLCFCCDDSSKPLHGPARAKGVKKVVTSQVTMKKEDSEANAESDKKKSDESGEEKGVQAMEKSETGDEKNENELDVKKEIEVSKETGAEEIELKKEIEVKKETGAEDKEEIELKEETGAEEIEVKKETGAAEKKEIELKKEIGAEEKEEIAVKKKSEESDYFKCGFGKCQQRMHKSCVENYSCSEYSPKQAQLLFGTKSPVCPAHFCWNCYDERSKNSSRFGELADCEKCLRSFHLACVPAGCRINEGVDGARKTFVCHYHAPPSSFPKISNEKRLKYCNFCEELVKKNDESRVECKGCTNIFHKECGYDEVKGKGANGEDMDTGYCSFCVNGGVIVPKQTLLAYFANTHEGLNRGYYPAEAVALSDIPSDLAKRLGSNVGKCGWIPVKWIWNGLENPYYNLVHRSLVHRMTQGCEKNLPNDDFLAELKKCARKFVPPTVPLDHEEMRKTITIVEKNVYVEGVNRVTVKRVVDSCSCVADKVTRIKCNTDDCENRSSLQECGKECDDGGSGEIRCANQGLQRSLQKPSKEKDGAPKKEPPPKKKYEVRQAPNNKGFGAFATETIQPLDYIFEYTGEVIDKTMKEIREDRQSQLRADDEWTYMMVLSTFLYVDARFKGGEARYANHSCEPNAIVNLTNVPIKYFGSNKATFEKRLKIEALRKINPGEEITLDYALDKSGGLALDNCRCGAPSCKRKLGKTTGDEVDLRFDRHDVQKGSDDEEEDEEMGEEEEEESDEEMEEGEEEEMDEDEKEEEEKENKRKKPSPARKTSKKNEKSEEMKEDEKPTRKRGLRLSVSSSPGPSTSKTPVKRGK